MEGTLIGLFIATWAVYFLVRRQQHRKAQESPARPPQAASVDPVKRLYELAQPVYGVYQESARPADLLRHPGFMHAVEHLASGPFRDQDLVAYYKGDNALLACLSLEALNTRGGAPLSAEILGHINNVAAWTRYFALRYLQARTLAAHPIVGPLLLRIDGSWLESPHSFQFLQEFVAVRVTNGEAPTFGDRVRDIVEAQGAFLRAVLARLGADLTGNLAPELEQWERSRIDTAYLRTVGQVWPATAGDGAGDVIAHEALQQHVEAVLAALARPAPRSVLLVGEAGVGKTAIVRALARRLGDAGWLFFEAGEPELVAGQSLIGQLEERLLKLVKQIGDRRRVLWYIPDFHALQWAGRTLYVESSALEILLPHIDSGNIVVLGETRPGPLERLLAAKPRCQHALEIRRIEPLAGPATLSLARAWAVRHGPADGVSLVPDPTLLEAQQLAQQYFPDRAAPGNVLRLLELAWKRQQGSVGTTPRPLGLDDLLGTLGELTGLPASMMDDRHDLHVDALRQHFDSRILGQTEAVDCLVERLAMIKAGVTDPNRPLGVFLFAGPTGTGKTAIAKALAEFLFGSSERMIRLDMTELQTLDAMNRLLGGFDGRGDGALVDRIRKQPFSVILLDEFEKAHPAVWDVFLQVFDDGRLTDRAGNTADFRHAIVIMTSNLGGLVPAGGLGFGRGRDPFVPEAVERVIAQSFRPEFLNRIDRTVVFRPLGRETMREILHKELDAITRRRGLRSRSWSIEWSDDAVEFLLAKGFTADLGARPLKRAIERYLLTPLALAIVNHQAPAGDQFLLVRRDGDRLAVEFVDLESAAETGGAGTPALGAVAARDAAPLALEPVAMDPRGSAAELASLRGHFERLRERVDDPAWQAAKSGLLAQMGSPAFWRSTARFTVLGEAEYRDRVEAGLRSAGSLLDRLSGTSPGIRTQYPPELMGRLAEKLYLLDAACTGMDAGDPHDAFVLVEAGRDRGATPMTCDAFARRLDAMYRAWAAKRHMQLAVLEAGEPRGGRPYRALLAVAGFAAYRILRLESGLHVFEAPREAGGFQRSSVRVRVVPQPAEYAGEDPRALRRQAVDSLRGEPGTALAVVRRYRSEPRPWVRDRVRGWRSSRLDRVLEGDFDLIPAAVEP